MSMSDLPQLPRVPELLGDYDRPAEYDQLVSERDVRVPMRDGVEICVDIHRPAGAGPLPVLLAFSIYNKDIQGPEVQAELQPQPAWAPLWTGCLEAGDTRFFTSRGYVHVIGSPRNIGKSGSGGDRSWDSYDLIEWIAAQPWCDGNVGMIGISGFAAEQWHAAKQAPPALKAIFPFDPRGAYGTLGGFREEYPGGVLHFFRYLIAHSVVAHQNKGAPQGLQGERHAWWQQAMASADFRMYPQLLNILTMCGQHQPQLFELLINPYEAEGVVAAAEQAVADIRIPAYTGSGWYAYGYKTHLNGAQNYFRLCQGPKRLLLCGSAHLERPFHGLNREMLQWYDRWLKRLPSATAVGPAVRYWVTGREAWREASEWPPAGVKWISFYLSSWERLRVEPYQAGGVDDCIPADVFSQMPLSQTQRVQKLRYVSEKLPADLTVAGPASLRLFAAIDAPDTSWIVALKDIGPGPGSLSAREGERELPAGLPEYEVSRGWLKASNRALDPQRSMPGRPWHVLTRNAAKPVTPGEIVEYQVGLMACAHEFKAGHRICVEIMCLDVPTGVGGATNAEYFPYHVCNGRTVTHSIYHDALRPSSLELPLLAG